MSDKTALTLFNLFFESLAKDPTPENKEKAQELYKHSRYYDFSDLDLDQEYLKILEINSNNIIL